MLKSLWIKNFRCLPSLHVERLAPVNLIVGDNNVGKTAFLEALFAHLVEGNIGQILLFKAFRRVPGATIRESLWRDLFTGMDDTQPIEISTEDSGRNLRRSVITTGTTSQLSLDVVPQATANGGKSEKMVGSSIDLKPLRVEYKGPNSREAFVNEIAYSPDKGMVQDKNFDPDLMTYYLSSAGPPEGETVAQHVSRLLIRKENRRLLEYARAIDQRIQSLTVASPAGQPEVYVDIGESYLVPLSLMGSGAARALAIAAAVPLQRGGVLLIDEIDNGLYHKRLRPFWEALIDEAFQDSVQLFATTHSGECIRAAIEAAQAQKRGDVLHIYRLVRGKDKPIPYEEETLSSVLEYEAEVR